MKIIRPSILAFAALLVTSLVSAQALAHCDTVDGPVVKAARVALKTRKVNAILIWVQPRDEAEVKNAFQKTLKVRHLGSEAREIADTYLFETVVRLHRAGEGESYTGLKAAGTNVSPIISALDVAIETGSTGVLLTKVPSEARAEFQKRLKEVLTRKGFEINDVAAGREYVKSYVTFIHYVEHLSEESDGDF